MVDWVHRYAAVVRTTPEPTGAARLAQADVLVFEVRDLADGCAAQHVDLANLAARQFDLRVGAVFRHQLSRGTGRANELSAFAFAHLDVVNHRAGRDVTERQAIAGANVRETAGDHGVALLQAVGREDVGLLAVGVVQERDARGAVGIVFDLRDASRDADLATLEIDDAVALLVTTPTEARGDAPVVVAAAGGMLALGQLLQRNIGGDLCEITDSVEAPARGGRLESSDTHVRYSFDSS